MSHRWWRRNGLSLAALPLVLGAAFVVAGRPLIDLWTEGDDTPDRTVGIGEPFAWDTGTFELLAVQPAPVPLDDDGDVFEPPPGTSVWRTAWRASGPDEYTGGGCAVDLVDADGRRFDADPAELNRLEVTRGCTPDTFDADPADYRFVRYFMLPADARPVAVYFGGLFQGETVEITLG